jgi:MarR family transcriptional regulator, organic hydroperoxide resistance regulator
MSQTAKPFTAKSPTVKSPINKSRTVKSTSVASPSAGLDELLCFLVYSTGFAFNRIYRKPLEKLGLTYPQYLVMVVLWAESGLTVGQIGERLRLDSSTLTPLLKRLDALGLVSRERSSEDERRVNVHLTARGRGLRRGAGAVSDCVAQAVGMSPAELAALMRQMQALRDRLEVAAA